MLQMKQNPMSDFQRCTTSMQRRCPTLNQHCTAPIQPLFKVAQRRFNVVSTLMWHYLNVVSTWPQRQLKL